MKKNTNKHIQIAVDIDGVILDILSPFCEICNKEYSTDIDPTGIDQWHFYREYGIDEKTAETIFQRIQKNIDAQPIIDISVTRELLKLSHTFTVDILTVRKSGDKNVLIQKLNSVGMVKGFHYRKIKTVPDTPKDIKYRYNYDIYIDDSPYLASRIRKEGDKYIILYDHAYNRHIEKNDNIKRVYGWIEIPKIANGLREKLR